ncbi:MAG: DUF2971 domain-containing protein [Candidatus Hydrogenedentes bacterium]|nr:DUF2971 domain-containing protein [Candidatus Hydrogenedentota bacterium]
MSADHVLPEFWELRFCYDGDVVLKLPLFLFEGIAPSAPAIERAVETKEVDDGSLSQARVTKIMNEVSWDCLEPYLVGTTKDTLTEVERLWRSGAPEGEPFSLSIKRLVPPTRIYRYVEYHEERIRVLLQDNKLFLPCPAMFNDPFDCGFEEDIRATFIECAMGCFSARNDSVLMFSHYADSHRGLCLEFDPLKFKLKDSIGKEGETDAKIEWDLRPVWYFPQLPPLSHDTEPALCATVKDALWAYEEEYRLFIHSNGRLLPYGEFPFVPEALTGVIFGCKASDDTVAEVKKLTAERKDFSRWRAVRTPGRFGLGIEPIRELKAARCTQLQDE